MADCSDDKWKSAVKELQQFEVSRAHPHAGIDMALYSGLPSRGPLSQKTSVLKTSRDSLEQNISFHSCARHFSYEEVEVYVQST